jgi:hypothetical protein
MLSACGGTRPASTEPASSPTAGITARGTGSAPPSTGGAAAAPTAAVSFPPASPLSGVSFGTAIASDGSAQNPESTFHAATDTRIIAVLALRQVAAGSSIGFIRYIDRKFVGSKTARLIKNARYFYFEFRAQASGFKRGEYLLRLYVNGRFAAEAAYGVV